MSNNSDQLPYDVWLTSRTVIRCLMVVIIFLLAFVGASLAGNVWLWQQKMKPFFVVLALDDKNKQVVKVERIEGELTVSQSELIKQAAFTSYVINRETINHVDEKIRFKQVEMMSSEKIFTEFRSQIDPQLNPDSVLSEKRFEREIEVKDSFSVEGVPNVWRVEFLVKDKFKGRAAPPRRMYAIIQFQEVDSKIKYEDRYLNLSGIEITSYKFKSLN